MDLEASRRRSGRAVAKPEKFTPASTTAQKRKRASEIDGDDDRDPSDMEVDDVQDDDESSDSASEAPDEEELKEQRRKKRTVGNTTKKGSARPTKKSKASKAKDAVALAMRPAKKAAAKPKKKTVTAPLTVTEEATGLYADVFDDEAELDEVADDWVKAFQKHESSAVADLFNLVLRAAGCNITITQYDVEDPDHFSDKLAEIQEEYQEQGITEYPLIAKGKTATAFRHTLTDFLDNFVQAVTKSKLLYTEPTLMEVVTSWVGSMSSAGNRPFRHTATVVSLAITTSLCDVANAVVQNVAKIQRQATGEKKKKGNKSRVTELEKQIEEAAKMQEQVDQYLQNWYDTVFVHRYRDVDFHIRVDCARALGGWIVKYPGRFFESSYLRYLGWIMSDTVAQTRHEVIKALVKLYKDEDNLSGLRSFSERFRPRMVEMATRDHDTSVRVATLELLDILRQAGFLEPDDNDQIGRLLFDNELRVRKAVVKFFAANVDDLYEAKVEELGGEAVMDELFEGHADNDENLEHPQPAWLRFKSLAELLQHYDAQDEIEPGDAQAISLPDRYLMYAQSMDSRFSLAAEVLSDHIDDLKNWEALSGYILYDHSQVPKQNGASTDAESSFKAECKLSEKEEILLLEVLNAVVKLSLSSTVEAANDSKKHKKPLTKKQKQDAVDVHETATRHLAQLIPRLLAKFSAIPDATYAVLRLEHVLNLEIFQELKQDQAAYSKLLEDVKKQFLTHNESRIVEEASRALLHAKSVEDLEEVTDEKLHSLWDATIDTFTKLTQGTKVGSRGTLSDQALIALAGTVLRMRKLAEISDPIEYLERDQTASSKSKKAGHTGPVISSLIDMIDRGLTKETTDVETDAEEDTLLLNVAGLTFQYFIWKVSVVRQQIVAGDKPSTQALDQIRERRQQFIDNIAGVLQARTGADDIRLSLAGTLIDVHAAFVGLLHVQPAKSRGEQMKGPDREIVELVQEVPRPVQELLLSILSASEKSFAKRSKRTLEEPEDDDDPEDDTQDPEADEEEDDDSEQHLAHTLLAERSLCNFAARVVLGLLAGVLDGKTAGKKVERDGKRVGAVEHRLRRNYKKLGQNFKTVIDELDGYKQGPNTRKAGARNNKQAAAQPANLATLTDGAKSARVDSAVPARTKPASKSKEIVIESDEEPELSDVDDEEDDEEAQALAAEERRRAVAEQDEEMDDADDGAGQENGDADSVVGD